MGRRRRPERDQAYELYKRSGGKLAPKDIAKELEEKPATIRRWKYEDRWEEKRIAERKGGGQYGNTNAKGHGAPRGNKNAEIHGGYSRVDISDLSEEDQEYIRSLTLDSETNMLEELKALIAKERDLEDRIKKVKAEEEEATYPNLVSETSVQMVSTKGQGKDAPMQRVIKSRQRESKFQREQKLLDAWDRLHGRIIKLLDSIKTYQIDSARIALDRERCEIEKEKAKGYVEIDIDDEIEDKGIEIDDEEDDL